MWILWTVHAKLLKISLRTTGTSLFPVCPDVNCGLSVLLINFLDIWFHRYENGRDIEGRFDYNSWVESEKGLKLAASLDKDVVLAEGYNEFATGRTYMAKMGDWRNNKDEEVELDGIGGVNILVKADVHRSGELVSYPDACWTLRKYPQESTSRRMHSKTKPKPKDSPRWQNGPDTKSTACQITLSGISTPRRNLATGRQLATDYGPFALPEPCISRLRFDRRDLPAVCLGKCCKRGTSRLKIHT